MFTKRTVGGFELMTMLWVLAPSPVNRTPWRRSPLVTPQAAKMILRPGASSLVL